MMQTGSRTSAWTLLGASVPGSSHLSRDLPCQDAWLADSFAGDIFAVAVADGAGSASHADLASRMAVEVAIGAVRAQSRWRRSPGIEKMLLGSFGEVRAELERQARIKEIPLGALATTLTLVIVMSDCIGVAQTGDGGGVGMRDDGQWLSLTIPQRGEYANETEFITGPDGHDPRFLEVYQPYRAFAVMTDGLLPFAVGHYDNQPHSPFLTPMVRAVENMDDPTLAHQQLESFLSSERVSAKSDDDKTIVIAFNLA